MPQYRNKETNEIVSIPRVRTIYHENGTSTEQDLGGVYDMTQYELYHEPDFTYSTVRVSKSPTDGHGIR